MWSAAGTKPAWANPYTGNVGRGGAYAGVNTTTGARYAGQAGQITNAYTGNSTGVQQKTSSGWETVQRSADRSWVQNQQNARGLGEMRTRGNLQNRGGGFRRR